MTQKSTVHAYSGGQSSPLAAPSPCNAFNLPDTIISNISDFDVFETNSDRMACYCIECCFSSKPTGAFFTAEIEEVRSSHDPLTAFASHRLHYTYDDGAGNKSDHYQDIGATDAGRLEGDFSHPFGQTNQDSVNFIMSVFPDPRSTPRLWHKAIQFFWYQNVKGGTTLDPDAAAIIGTSGLAFIPNTFQPTDLSVEFVAIEGDVQFSKELSAQLQIGEQPAAGGVKASAAMAYLQTDGTMKCDSPCVTQFAKETSNAQQTLQGTATDGHSVAALVHI